MRSLPHSPRISGRSVRYLFSLLSLIMGIMLSGYNSFAFVHSMFAVCSIGATGSCGRRGAYVSVYHPAHNFRKLGIEPILP